LTDASWRSTASLTNLRLPTGGRLLGNDEDACAKDKPGNVAPTTPDAAAAPNHFMKSRRVDMEIQIPLQ
jgi:hypothetical protein